MKKQSKNLLDFYILYKHELKYNNLSIDKARILNRRWFSKNTIPQRIEKNKRKSYLKFESY